MATLPDPTDRLTGADKAMFDHMAAARAHADGRPELGQVYVRMFNNPGLAAKVGALGEQIRFNGVLPDDVREMAILRFAAQRRYGYEWAHHQRPARLAGVSQGTVDALTAGRLPAGLSDGAAAAIEAVDAVADGRSIDAAVQSRVVAAFGLPGVVELVVLCGLYSIMGDMCIAFDIHIEEGFPRPPF
jgi:4-carboxymuconolactone decarboxylase